MSRIRRRSTKAETRLETLEGRITPTASSMQTVIGAQILVLARESGAMPTGLTRAESLALNHYEHIQNAKKAQIFLSHHHRLEKWLDRVAYYPTAPAGSTPTNANNQTTPTTQGPDTATNQAVSSSTTPSSNSDTGQPAQTGAQGTIGTNQQGDTTQGSTSSTTSSANGSPGSSSTAALDNTLSQIYQSYKDGTIDQVMGQYDKLAILSVNDVEVDIHGNGGSFQDLLDDVGSLDPQISVTDSDSTYQLIVAEVPIADLMSLAAGADDLIQSITAQSPPQNR